MSNSFRETISSGMVGLSLTNAMSCVSNLTILVWRISMLETNAISLERVKEYSENTKQEPAYYTQVCKLIKVHLEISS